MNSTTVDLNEVANEKVCINVKIVGGNKLLLKIKIAQLLCWMIKKMFPKSEMVITNSDSHE